MVATNRGRVCASPVGRISSSGGREAGSSTRRAGRGYVPDEASAVSWRAAHGARGRGGALVKPNGLRHERNALGSGAQAHSHGLDGRDLHTCHHPTRPHHPHLRPTLTRARPVARRIPPRPPARGHASPPRTTHIICRRRPPSGGHVGMSASCPGTGGGIGAAPPGNGRPPREPGNPGPAPSRVTLPGGGPRGRRAAPCRGALAGWLRRT
jgi:hypothetical protein